MIDSNELSQAGETSPLRENLAREAISGLRLLNIFKKIVFQKLMIVSIYRLVLYINKIYQDVFTAKEYYSDQDFYFFLISIITLITPPLIYSIYLIG